MTVQAFIASLIIIVAETLGLWFLNTRMVIEPERIVAANWVYQASIVSFLLVVFQAPFIAIVTSNERMDLFAYISVLDAVLKLGIVFVLQILGGDKLIIYSLLVLLIGITNLLLYYFVCTIKLHITSVKLGRDKNTIRLLASFGGWGMMDSLATTLKSNGLNIVINLFFGTLVNAARGIAYQVLTAVNQFITAFQNSFRPQMTKSFAAGDISYLKRIYYSCTKLSYYLIITISLPIMLETPYILHLWLGEVPNHTVSFTRLVLVTAFVSAFANPTSGIAYSSGKIKWFTILVSIVNILIIPVAYIFLKLGYSAESAMVVSLVFTILAQIVRVFVVKNLAPMPIIEYLRMVVLPTSLYTVLTPLLPWIIVNSIERQSFFRLAVVTTVSIACSLGIAWTIGLNKIERRFVKSKLKSIRTRN